MTAPLHPKDTPSGAIAWARPTHYIVGDRARGTILLITQDSLVEMVPEVARALGQELLDHADDCERQPSTVNAPPHG